MSTGETFQLRCSLPYVSKITDMFQSLPAELIYKILDELDSSFMKTEQKQQFTFVCDRAKSLSALSLTCHRIRTLVAPILFERISYKLSPELRLGGWDDLLLRNPLVQFPNLTALVR